MSDAPTRAYNPVANQLTRMQRRRQEAMARTVPYTSFLLTHAAFLLFLGVVVFLVESNLLLKAGLIATAAIFLATEWLYTCLSARRWRRTLLALSISEDERHEAAHRAEVAAHQQIVEKERDKQVQLLLAAHRRWREHARGVRQ